MPSDSPSRWHRFCLEVALVTSLLLSAVTAVQITNTIHSTHADVTLGPEYCCAGAPFGKCGRKYDAWVLTTYSSWEGKHTFHQAQSSGNDLHNRESTRHMSIPFKGSSVFLYMAPRRFLHHPPGYQEICMYGSCQRLDVLGRYEAAQDSEKPVLLWWAENLDQNRETLLELRLIDAGRGGGTRSMSFQYLKYTRDVDDVTTPSLAEGTQLVDVTIQNTDSVMRYTPQKSSSGCCGDFNPWDTRGYGNFWSSFHHTSNWESQPYGDRIRQVSFTFRGAAIHLYGPPPGALKDIWGDGLVHGHQEVCINDKCGRIDVHQAYLRVSREEMDSPVLLWSLDLFSLDPFIHSTFNSFSKDEIMTLRLRLLDPGSPVRGSHMVFDHAVVSEIQDDFWWYIGQTLTSIGSVLLNVALLLVGSVCSAFILYMMSIGLIWILSLLVNGLCTPRDASERRTETEPLIYNWPPAPAPAPYRPPVYRPPAPRRSSVPHHSPSAPHFPAAPPFQPSVQTSVCIPVLQPPPPYAPTTHNEDWDVGPPETTRAAPPPYDPMHHTEESVIIPTPARISSGDGRRLPLAERIHHATGGTNYHPEVPPPSISGASRSRPNDLEVPAASNPWRRQAPTTPIQQRPPTATAERRPNPPPTPVASGSGQYQTPPPAVRNPENHPASMATLQHRSSASAAIPTGPTIRDYGATSPQASREPVHGVPQPRPRRSRHRENRPQAPAGNVNGEGRSFATIDGGEGRRPADRGPRGNPGGAAQGNGPPSQTSAPEMRQLGGNLPLGTGAQGANARAPIPQARRTTQILYREASGHHLPRGISEPYRGSDRGRGSSRRSGGARMPDESRVVSVAQEGSGATELSPEPGRGRGRGNGRGRGRGGGRGYGRGVPGNPLS